MSLTQAQIQAFTLKAKDAGLTDEQIRQAVAKKEQELRGTTLDTTGVTIQPKAQLDNIPTLDSVQKKDGNFITNTAKALVQPAVDYGKFVGESVAQASRVGAEALASKQGIFGADEIDKQIGQLTRQNREIIAQMKSEKDKTKKKELAVKSREIDAQIESLGNQAREIGGKKTTFLIDENKIKNQKDIALTGAKATAGAASYAVPGSIGVGGSALGTVARAAGAGAIAGGLQGFGSSKDGQELNNTITGAAVGGVTAGVISGAGQVIKAVKNSRMQSEIGKKLSQAGTDFKKSAYVKAMGRKPIMNEGGDKLLDKMMKVGIKPGDPDLVMHQADDILIDNAGIIFDKADEFSQKGVTIDKAKITGPLEAKLKSAPAKSKPIIQRVLDFVKSDLDRFDELTPAEAYAMKGDYGPFGNWTSQMDADQVTEAKMWEEVYKNISDLMDESFKKNGYDDFRVINEQVSTAINAKKWASRAGNVAPNLNTLGLMDVLYGAGGMGLTGGVGGVVGGMAVKKAVNSPQTASIIGQTLEQLGQNMGNKVTTSASQAGSGMIGDIATRLATRTAVDASLLDNTENLQNNGDNTNNYKGDNGINNKLQNNAPLSDNNTQIIPQKPVSQHPIPKFREFANKDEMVAAAFADGLGSKDVAELVKLWDQFAPTSAGVIPVEVESLLEKRKLLSNAGVSTKNIDAQLAQYGFEPDTTANLSSSTENRVQLATSGLRALDEIETLLAEDPTKMLKNVIPGKLGARDYDSAAFRAVEGLLRARSGAAIPESEVRRYMNANLPKIGDSKEEMQAKLSAFRKDLEDIALSSGSFDAATVLGM